MYCIQIAPDKAMAEKNSFSVPFSTSAANRRFLLGNLPTLHGISTFTAQDPEIPSGEQVNGQQGQGGFSTPVEQAQGMPQSQSLKTPLRQTLSEQLDHKLITVNLHLFAMLRRRLL